MNSQLQMMNQKETPWMGENHFPRGRKRKKCFNNIIK